MKKFISVNTILNQAKEIAQGVVASKEFNIHCKKIAFDLEIAIDVFQDMLELKEKC